MFPVLLMTDVHTIDEKEVVCKFVISPVSYRVSSMRLHRFFVSHDVSKGGTITLPEPKVIHQMRSVFRFHPGDKVVLFNGDGTDYVSEIVTLERERGTFHIVEQRPALWKPRVKLTMVVSMTKKDTIEWSIQKAVELGVSVFVPVISQRSEKKGFNTERVRRIIIEATEQSGRADLMEVSEPVSLDEWLVRGDGCVIAFHTSGETLSMTDVSGHISITTFIGPEGGWSDEELSIFKEKGFLIRSLSTPVLRAETAVTSVASILVQATHR